MPAATAAVVVALALLSGLAMLAFLGKLPVGRERPAGAVFYVVPYHYGFALYDRELREVERITVRAGDSVTLTVIPAHALPEPVFRAYNERSYRLAIGGLPAGDPRIALKMAEDLALGNVEHIVGIAAHSVRVTTDVTSLLAGQPFRHGGPATLRAAVETNDPSLRSVTFTARRAGAYDVLCVDSGMDGAGTCGWGHKWMVARGAFVVEP